MPISCTVENATSSLFVGNLCKGVTEKELREIFSPYGEILSVAIKERQGGQINYGFLNFAQRGSVERILSVDNFVLNGKRLKVGEAHTPKNLLSEKGRKLSDSADNTKKYDQHQNGSRKDDKKRNHARRRRHRTPRRADGKTTEGGTLSPNDRPDNRNEASSMEWDDTTSENYSRISSSTPVNEKSSFAVAKRHDADSSTKNTTKIRDKGIEDWDESDSNCDTGKTENASKKEKSRPIATERSQHISDQLQSAATSKLNSGTTESKKSNIVDTCSWDEDSESEKDNSMSKSKIAPCDSDMSTTSLSNKGPSPSYSSGHSTAGRGSALKQSESKGRKYLKEVELPSMTTVQITHLDKKNGYIYVRPCSVQSLFREFQAKLKRQSFRVAQSINYGYDDFVYCNYMEEWHRGRIKDILSSNAYRVLLIDSGFMISCSCQYISPVDDWFFEAVQFCRRTKLRGISCTDMAEMLENEEISNRICGHVNNELFTCEVVRQFAKDSTLEVNLYLYKTKISILDEMTPPIKSSCADDSSSPKIFYRDLKRLPFEKSDSYLFTHISSPSEFYISNPQNANDIYRSISAVTVDSSSIIKSELCEDQIVLARYEEDNMLYRARILTNDGSGKCYVNFIDYGNSESVDRKSLYPLTAEIAAFPLSTYKCALNAYVSRKNSNWSPKVIERLKTFTNEKLFKFQIVSEDPKTQTYFVNCRTLKNEDIVDFIQNQKEESVQSTDCKPKESGVKTDYESLMKEAVAEIEKSISLKKELLKVVKVQIERDQRAKRRLEKIQLMLLQ